MSWIKTESHQALRRLYTDLALNLRLILSENTVGMKLNTKQRPVCNAADVHPADIKLGHFGQFQMHCLMMVMQSFLTDLKSLPLRS